MPIQVVKLPTMTVTGLPSPFDQNELELWNVEFWQLKNLQIRLYLVFLKVPRKHKKKKKKLDCKR